MTAINHNVSDEELLAAFHRMAESDPAHFDAVLRELIITEGAEAPDTASGCSHKRLDDPGVELAAGEGGAVALADLPTIERIIATNNLLPVHFLSEGALVQRAVARVEVPGGFGTGSLISNSLLLTNNHVISSVTTAANSKARFNFQVDHEDVDQPADAYQLDPDSYFRTNAALDYTVVRVKAKPFPVKAIKAIKNDIELEMELEDTSSPTIDPALLNNIDLSKVVAKFPRLAWFAMTPGLRWGHLRLPSSGPAFAQGQYYNIVGHPRGRRKEVSLQDNKVTEIFTNVVHYTTDTEPGSSGSPVFNNSWELVALHHAAGHQVGGQWVDNEGIRIDKIVDDLQANAPAAIQSELGI